MPMILIRHGESLAVDHPELWKIPCNSAVGLSAKGVQQAVELSSVMSKLLSSLPDGVVHEAGVYTSGMERAIQTKSICSSLSTYRTIGGYNPYNRYAFGPDLNEFLNWNDPHDDHNPYLTAGDPYTLWLEDKNGDQKNIHSWSNMRLSMRSSKRFMASAKDINKLVIVFAHHYPINAILAEASPYSDSEGNRIHKSLVRYTPIPNAVPILLGFPVGTTFPGCLIGETLVEKSQRNSVPA